MTTIPGPLRTYGQIYAQGVSCSSDVAMENNHIKGKLRAVGEVKLTDCIVGEIWSHARVQLTSCTADQVETLGAIFASRSRIFGHIHSDFSVTLQEDSEAKSIKSIKDINIFFSCVMGKVQSLNGNLKIQDSKIYGNASVYGKVVDCKNTKISGILKCSNLSLEVIQSEIEQIHLTEPMLYSKGSQFQTVILRDSHVKHIIFENGKGRVKLVGSATVCRISGGDFS